MVSHGLPCSTVTNQTALDQQDLYSTPEFQRAMERRCQALISKLETLDTITFTQLYFEVEHSKFYMPNFDDFEVANL